MKIIITQELIDFAKAQNDSLETQAKKRMKFNFLLSVIFMTSVSVLSYVAMDFRINIPKFISPNNLARSIIPQVNAEPLEEHMNGYVRRTVASLLSLDFNNLQEDLLEKKSLFIEGKFDEYLIAVYGSTNLNLPPVEGSFAHKVIDESLVVTAVAFGPNKKVGRELIVEGEKNNIFLIELWQGTEGIGSDYISQRVTAHIMVQTVPRDESKNGLLIRSFYVKD